MGAKFRYRDLNLIAATGATFIASSEHPSLPGANVARGQLGTRWRSKPGWTIVLGENDTITFNRGGGTLVATIAAGYYPTGALLATAIVAALQAADPTPAWAANYGVTAANKFTISTAAHNFVLMFAALTEPKSVHKDLGFASANTASALTHTAGSVSYQSRQALNVDIGTAELFTVAIVAGHNLSTAAVATLHSDSVTLVGVGYEAIVEDLILPAVGSLRMAEGTQLAARYYRLLLEDVQNPVGYVEVGVLYVGTTAELTVDPSVQYAREREHLSEVHYADGGAHHQVKRPRRKVHKLLFQLEERGGLAVADRAILDAVDALGIGASFFITYDAPSEPALTVYGFNRIGLHEVYQQGAAWAVALEVAEALG